MKGRLSRVQETIVSIDQVALAERFAENQLGFWRIRCHPPRRPKRNKKKKKNPPSPRNNQKPKVVIMWMPCCVCFHFRSGQDSVRTRGRLMKKYPPAQTPPPEKRRVSEGSGEPCDVYVITSLESIFPLKKKQGTCALYCEQFPRFSRLLSGLHNEGRGAAEFPPLITN